MQTTEVYVTVVYDVCDGVKCVLSRTTPTITADHYSMTQIFL